VIVKWSGGKAVRGPLRGVGRGRGGVRLEKWNVWHTPPLRSASHSARVSPWNPRVTRSPPLSHARAFSEDILLSITQETPQRLVRLGQARAWVRFGSLECGETSLGSVSGT